MAPPYQNSAVPLRATIWWTNSIFFSLIHALAAIGVYLCPPGATNRKTHILAFVLWQLGEFGITIGYHRLYSHRAFRAKIGVRIVLAILGSSAFQGSIKWWCIRHRLHHRFTDDLVHDPYAASRGLFYSHMGWIFFKPSYEKISLLDREDLESDPVVRLQHQHYVPMALFFGLAFPSLVGMLWQDGFGALVWAGLVTRVAIWHCTFLVNSLAHWDGLQPYSDENSSRGNLLLAVLTSGEGNHNFHAFPYDYRSGPSNFDWDPSKWLILTLCHLGVASDLRQARKEDMKEAVDYMRHKRESGAPEEELLEEWQGTIWTFEQVREYALSDVRKCVVIIDEFAVDLTSYLSEHPGGPSILRKYSVPSGDRSKAGVSRASSWAFNGGLNNHSRSAVQRMRELRVAKVVLENIDAL